MDFVLLRFKQCSNKTTCYNVQFIVLGIHDVVQICICFYQREAIKKITIFDNRSNTFICISLDTHRNIWNVFDSDILVFDDAWNDIISIIWTFFSVAFWIRYETKLYREFWIFNVWIVRWGNNNNVCGIFNGLDKSINAFLVDFTLQLYFILGNKQNN